MEQNNNYDNALKTIEAESVEHTKPMTKDEKVKSNENLANPWQSVIMGLLSYKGKYYPQGTEVFVKPFKTAEVVYFTSINEKNPVEVDRAMRYLISKCVKVKVNGKTVDTLSFLFNNDRFATILLARTYSDMKTDLTFDHECTKCKTTNKVKVIPQNIIYKDDKISHKWDDKEQLFLFEANGIKVGYSPVTIRETNDLFEFMMDNKDDLDQSDLKAMSKIFPFMRLELMNAKSMNDVYDAFRDLGMDKIVVMSNMAEKIPLEMAQQVSTKCTSCGHSEVVQMRFPNGIKSIVVDTVEIDDFLR